MSLLMHCGAHAIDRAGLAAIPTPPPMGRFHHPYPYIDFVERVEEALQVVGFTTVEEQFGALKDGARFFGLMEVRPQNDTGDRDYGMMIGLRGSHDQSFPRGLVAGSRVFVCDNLCFSGEINLNTRQTTHIERRLPGMILNAVETLPGVFEVQNRRFDAYRDFQLRPRWGDAAITELVRREIVNPSQVGRVIAEWDEPSHPEHAENGHTAWRFHNAVTEALKMPVDANTGLPSRAAAPMAMERTIGLTSFLDEVVGL